MPTSKHSTKLGPRGIQRPAASVAKASDRDVVSSNAGDDASARSVDGLDLAVRMLSETAHDLRSPLTTIRESVRLVRDGDLGSLNEDQQSLLMAAMDEVDRVNQMIGDMSQLERLRSGIPRTRREWISVKALREQVDQTLRPWSIPRGVNVLWDGVETSGGFVYADKQLMGRLLVNLVANAIRASDEGGTVLIKLDVRRGGETVGWTVIDRGAGIPEAELTRIASRHVSLAGGEGLGLAISRQLAALHFSNLAIRSRMGVGTEVSFETPAAGPHSVAQAWTRWRVQATSPLKQRPTQRGSRSITKDTAPEDTTIQRTLRLDPPVFSVSLRSETLPPRCPQQLTATIVSLGADTQRADADRFDGVLQNQLTMFELAYRVDTRRWVCILDADATTISRRLEAIDEMCVRSEPALRRSWGEPQIISVDENRLGPRMSDLLIRHSLNQSISSHRDGNEVRLGTAPIGPSPIASDRLDGELRRLSERWRKQSLRFSHHAEQLRPRGTRRRS